MLSTNSVVEHATLNLRVVGSNPILGAIVGYGKESYSQTQRTTGMVTCRWNAIFQALFYWCSAFSKRREYYRDIINFIIHVAMNRMKAADITQLQMNVLIVRSQLCIYTCYLVLTVLVYMYMMTLNFLYCVVRVMANS